MARPLRYTARQWIRLTDTNDESLRRLEKELRPDPNVRVGQTATLNELLNDPAIYRRFRELHKTVSKELQHGNSQN